MRRGKPRKGFGLHGNDSSKGIVVVDRESFPGLATVTSPCYMNLENTCPLSTLGLRVLTNTKTKGKKFYYIARRDYIANTTTKIITTTCMDQKPESGL